MENNLKSLKEKTAHTKKYALKGAYLAIIFCSFLSNFIFGQENGKCKPIILNDSLFKVATYNGFNITSEYNRKSDSLKNKKLFSLENGTLKFNISTNPHDKKIELVTNGILNTDSKGRNFYFIKLLFHDDIKPNELNEKGEYMIQGLIVFRQLCFNISSLLSNNNADYILFYGEQELIITRQK